MKSPPLNIILALTGIAVGSGALQAQPTAHYCPGVEGLEAASVPPPGYYVRDYNSFYMADRVNGPTGQSVGPANFNIFTYAQVPRLIWVTDAKLLGANVGVNTLLPIVYESVTAGPYSSHDFSVGDLFADGFLAWHAPRFDFVLAEGVWMPTGRFSPGSTYAGLGYWGDMVTFGGTWWMDTNKTWAVSVLNRYEINGEQRDTHITPGNAYTVEWGVSKSLNQAFTVGIAGYYQSKVTSDSGTGAACSRDSVAAVGPEISTVIPVVDVLASLRYLDEFAAYNRAQGQTITLTLTKRF